MSSTPSSVGPAGSMPVAGSPGAFNCPAGVLPASDPIAVAQGTLQTGTPSVISNYRMPQVDAPAPSYVIDGVNYWWRSGYFEIPDIQVPEMPFFPPI